MVIKTVHGAIAIGTKTKCSTSPCSSWIKKPSLCFSCRCLPSTVSELQAEAKHWILHPADVHALHPHHHPILGVVLDKLWCLGGQSCIRYDVSRAGDRPQLCGFTFSQMPEVCHGLSPQRVNLELMVNVAVGGFTGREKNKYFVWFSVTQLCTKILQNVWDTKRFMSVFWEGGPTVFKEQRESDMFFWDEQKV